VTATACVLDAMRSGEWLRTQWIGRVAFGAAPPASHVEPTRRALRVLRRLEQEGLVERRAVEELRQGELAPGVTVAFPVPRSEWRLPDR
jgi:hypothetical protein